MFIKETLVKIRVRIQSCSVAITSAICRPIYYHGYTLWKKTDEYHFHHNSSHRNSMHSWQDIAKTK